MDLRQLKYFTRIVELESFTVAAESLHIAQPSLSQHVANLESELDTPLLIRGPGGVRTTKSGDLLYHHAKMVLRQLDEARAAVKHGRNTPSGHVSFGLPTSTSRVLAVPLIEAVAREFPEVVLELVEGSNADLAESVARQRLDLTIAMDVTQQPTRMQVEPLLDEYLLLVGPPSGSGTSITLAEVAALPLVLPSFPNSIRLLAERAFSDAGLAFNLIAETSAVSILLALVRTGRGWTILPASVLSMSVAEKGNIEGIPISDRKLTRRASVCLSSSAQQSLACLAVRTLTVALVQDMVSAGRWQGVTLING
ncbi:LysR substrate-binding domain-containing protein [Bordetella sp. FB-8]|uniref:LysR substrate-binding domain-containing protein n=1 Tax=Bordetella sp. FB-8 TaxID=1159870 RepID=UPI00036A7839|nr:LysR substrate-binding domain-containing protein [Bordetella sp. FB-8]